MSAGDSQKLKQLKIDGLDILNDKREIQAFAEAVREDGYQNLADELEYYLEMESRKDEYEEAQYKMTDR